MKAKLLSVAVALLALWAVPSAFADSGGSGGFQAGAQSASTNQAALGAAASYQNAVNANVPVSIAGGNVTSGPSSAGQTATSSATTDVSNKAKTDQDQHLNQNIGGNSGCYAGCGGAGGFQAGVQNADTNQLAAGAAVSNQNAVNANVPVSIAGGNVNSGPSSASQNASSSASTDVSNKAKTDQDQSLQPEHRRRFLQARLRRRGRIPGRDPGRPDQPAGCRGREERPERRERERARLDRRWERLLRPEQRDADGDVERDRRRLEQGQDRPGSAPQPEHRRGLVPGRLRWPGRLPGRRPEAPRPTRALSGSRRATRTP